jgi:hypothetical protein
MVELPRHLYRVVFDAAVGWPHPDHRQRKHRTFTSPEYAGRQLARIEALPSHLRLVGVYVTGPLEWTELDPADIPRPEPQEEPTDV